jgi:hypothetical protein
VVGALHQYLAWLLVPVAVVEGIAPYSDTVSGRSQAVVVTVLKVPEQYSGQGVVGGVQSLVLSACKAAAVVVPAVNRIICWFGR